MVRFLLGNVFDYLHVVFLTPPSHLWYLRPQFLWWGGCWGPIVGRGWDWLMAVRCPGNGVTVTFVPLKKAIYLWVAALWSTSAMKHLFSTDYLDLSLRGEAIAVAHRLNRGARPLPRSRILPPRDLLAFHPSHDGL